MRLAWSILAEAATSVTRHPARSLLCALGTVVAVGSFTTTNGLTESASNAVSASFNELQATTVVFQGPPTLTDADVARLDRLHGVLAAGLVWDVAAQQPMNVTDGPDGGGSVAAQLSVTAMSAAALGAVGAVLSAGRLYDSGADMHHQMVALLGAGAAAQLGIASPLGQPAISIAGVTLTVIGIVRSTQLESQSLLGVIVPPYVAGVISTSQDPRRVDVRTAPGAAQLIGRQGPTELDPWDPAAVSADVPPDPSTLRAQVQGALASLLALLSLVGVGIGLLSITAVTIISVMQRREEIGLRRAVGYSRLQIAWLVLLEAAGIGALGGLFGTSLGVLATAAIASHNHWTPVMSPVLIILAPAVGIGIGVLAGSYPATRAARITPIKALRGQG